MTKYRGVNIFRNEGPGYKLRYWALTEDGQIAANTIQEMKELIREGEERRKSKVTISCDQCEMLSINGVACHETGCPNMGAKWEDGEWVKYYKCFECGCDVRKGEVCTCFEPCEEEE